MVVVVVVVVVVVAVVVAVVVVVVVGCDSLGQEPNYMQMTSKIVTHVKNKSCESI